MVWQTPLLSALPSGVLDMTTDFAPLFMGLVVGVGICILGLAFAIGVHDRWWDKRQEQPVVQQPVPAPHFG